MKFIFISEEEVVKVVKKMKRKREICWGRSDFIRPFKKMAERLWINCSDYLVCKHNEKNVPKRLQNELQQKRNKV